MCGIAGIFDLKERSLISKDRLLRMGQAIARRGPDDQGLWRNTGGIGMVHQRLQVIDPQNGAQPMATPDNRVCLVYNGMIYNFRELRARLEAQGYIFQTHSDTEVILHGWLHWRVDLPRYLDGFFAIAIYDLHDNSLTLMRDRWGQKPLYYTIENNQILFASDVPALLQGLSSRPDIRMDAFSDYITLGYVPDPKSIFEGIYKLPPAHILRVAQGETCAPSLQRYWSIHIDPQDHGQTMEDAAQELDALLDQAIQKRMIADVPIGTFLSGGLDSAAIVSTMTKHMEPNQISTCTLGFDEAAFDEREAAAQTAQHCGTNHMSKCVYGDTLLDMLALTLGFGEPFADPSALPMLQLAHFAKQHMVVALSGDGGDELFAGYRRYPFHLKEEQIKGYIPTVLRTHLFGVLSRLYPRGSYLPRPLRAQATFEALAHDTATGLLRATGATTSADKRKMMRADVGLTGYDTTDIIRTHLNNAQTDDPLARIQYVDMMTWLPGRMLVKVDRASMYQGLEVRNPFLDIRVAEWASKLPTRLKLKGFSGKRILRHTLAKKVPPSIVHAPKRGFTPPIQSWLEGPLRAQLESLTQQDWVRSYLNTKTVDEFVSQQLKGRIDRKTTLWALLVFDAWHNHYVK